MVKFYVPTWSLFAGPVTYARAYPAATPKGVADLCLCQLPTMHVRTNACA